MLLCFINVIIVKRVGECNEIGDDVNCVVDDCGFGIGVKGFDGLCYGGNWYVGGYFGV